MVQKAKQKVLVSRYINALKAVVKKQDQMAMFERFECLVGCMLENDVLIRILTDPLIEKEDKKRIMQALTKISNVGAQVSNLLYLLVDKGRLFLLDLFYGAIQDEIYMLRKEVKASVVTAYPLDAKEKDQIVMQLQAISGDKVIADFNEKNELIGGFQIFINNVLYDGSVKNALSKVKDQLMTHQMG